MRDNFSDIQNHTIKPVVDWKNTRTAGRIPVWGESWARAPQHVSALHTPIDGTQQAQKPPSFKDVLDTINPLQQLPIVGNMYRSITGDSISPLAKFAGGALFGGPIGAVVALASIAFEEETGQDPVSVALNGFKPQSKPENSDFSTLLAQYSRNEPLARA